MPHERLPIGQEGAQQPQLLERLRGGDPSPLPLLHPELIERGSTAPPAR